MTTQGGCHCGNIRYQLSADPFDADYCHCLDCQKTTGAPFGAWMDFKVDEITWLGAPIKEYASSDSIRRGFCPDCGCTLSYRSTQYPDYLTLSICSLDDASGISPKYHIHTQRQQPWLKISDNCPRYLKSRSEG